MPRKGIGVIDEKGLPSLDGKAGVVAGPAAGLGCDALLAPSAAGAQELGAGVDKERGFQAAHEAIQAARAAAVFQRGDIRNEKDIVAEMGRYRREFGRFNLINSSAALAIEKHLRENPGGRA